MTDKCISEQKLLEISLALEKNYRLKSEVGLLDGLGGVALFFFYYGRFKNIDKYAEIGTQIIELIIEKINQGYNFPTYCTGIAGAGWVIEHLFENDFIDKNNDSLLQPLDDYLEKTMLSDLKSNNFDFLHGAIGYGTYFLKRYKNTFESGLKERYKNSVLKLISGLKKNSEKDIHGIKWISILDPKTNLTGYNLSLSHGISSIISFLVKTYEFDDFKTYSKALLLKSIDYLARHEISETNKKYYMYPIWIARSRPNPIHSPLAWCYGDLGVALSFHNASKVLKNKDLYSKSISILENATNRKSNLKTGIVDAGICHGAFGVCEIFNSIYKNTDKIVFKKASDYWLNVGLNMSEKGIDSGFTKWNGKLKKWEFEVNLLEGISGVGLAIIDHLQKQKNNWNESLYIS